MEYLIIVTLLINGFTDILDSVQNSISDITSFMNLLIPILVTLISTTGKIVSSSVVDAVLLASINIMGNLINNLIVPLILISTALSIVSNFSDQIHIGRFSKFIKSATIWVLGIILTIFVCLLSIQGTLSNSVDLFTTKTAKTAISSLIPVVGKIMGDSVDSVIGCANIIKNAVGAIGLIVIFSIVLVPIIKIIIIWALIRLLSALCESIADEKIVRLLDEIGDSYKTLFGILFSVSVMFIIGITIVLRVTNI